MDKDVVTPNTSVLAPLTLSVVPLTCTVLVLLNVPAVAVNIIVRFVGSPPVVRKAVAVPVIPVVPLVTWIPPELATKFTAIPLRTLFDAFRTSAVSVAASEP